MSALSLALLGPFIATLDGRPIAKFRSNRVQALLIYLAVEAGRVHRRDALMALLWPDLPEESAQVNLRQTIYQLRKAIPAVSARDDTGTVPFVLAERQSVGINPDGAYELDVAAFRRLAADDPSASGLAHAVTLYRGDFLVDFYLPDSDTFEEWVAAQRAELQQQALETLERLTRTHLRAKDYDRAEAYARRQLTIDNLREGGHQQLLEVLARSGQRTSALAHYESYRRLLLDEFGEEPPDDTTQLYERICAARPRRPTVPLQPTPFFGRASELAAIAETLSRPDCRLLNIVGPGGIGKTRLALEVVQANSAEFLNGAYYVPLESLERPDSLLVTIASAVGFTFHGARDPKTQLLDFLRPKEMLLLLDNFEHLLDGAPLVADILRQAPGVKILITSRVRLSSPWEWVFPVEGLEVPARDAVEQIDRYSAARLFIHCARRSQRQFDPATAAPDVVRICRLVEGTPLGIELAAAWVYLMPCADIAREIERGLDTLATPATDVSPRHRSIRAVFDHSWRMLTAGERAALRRLSVFRGAFSREAAQEVAGASREVLGSLMDKSLVRQPAPGRYALHELVRQYADEKLAENPEEWTELRDRHGAYYAAFLHEREGALQGIGQRAALAEIEQDVENVRAAWRWLVSQGDLQPLAQSLNALVLCYDLRSWFKEGVELFGGALEGVAQHPNSGEPELLRARILVRQAKFHCRLSEYDRALAELDASIPLLEGLNERAEIANALHVRAEVQLQMGSFAAAKETMQASFALYKALGDERGIANTSIGLSMLDRQLGEYAASKAYCEEALALCIGLEDESGAATALHSLGLTLYFMGDYAGAERCYNESLALNRKLDNRWGLATLVNCMGLLSHAQGDSTAAERQYQESYELFRELGDSWGRALTRANLGRVALERGDFAEARRQYRGCLDMAREIGDQRGVAIALESLGDVDYASKLYGEAAHLYEESLSINRAINDMHCLISNLTRLGDTRAALGIPRDARAYYAEALELGRRAGTIPQILEALVGVAALSIESGNRKAAIGLLALVLEHPSAKKPVREKAQRLMDALTGREPGIEKAARLRARQQSVEDVVAALLADAKADRALARLAGR